jgi:hypothetical protein
MDFEVQEILRQDPDNLDLFYNLASATWTSASSIKDELC